MRKNLKGSIFYGKSIERNVERVCEQPAFYRHNGDHEQHERMFSDVLQQVMEAEPEEKPGYEKSERMAENAKSVLRRNM